MTSEADNRQTITITEYRIDFPLPGTGSTIYRTGRTLRTTRVVTDK